MQTELRAVPAAVSRIANPEGIIVRIYAVSSALCDWASGAIGGMERMCKSLTSMGAAEHGASHARRSLKINSGRNAQLHLNGLSGNAMLAGRLGCHESVCWWNCYPVSATILHPAALQARLVGDQRTAAAGFRLVSANAAFVWTMVLWRWKCAGLRRCTECQDSFLAVCSRGCRLKWRHPTAPSANPDGLTTI